ncbi:MAG: alpha/beta hydrolase-fold protein [Gemmatimonadota bacterium]|nr:alpha/beta hydrolase-fold protein [Gemmatimonadota bacterium]
MRATVVLFVAAIAATSAAPLRAQPVPPQGRIVADTVPAPSLAGNLLGDPTRQPALVYLPPGYEEEPGRRYPTIYLLHGVLDSPSIWVEPVYQGMTIQAVMDSLIAVGEIRPAIVVMPSGHNAFGASGYMNSPVAGRWGDFIASDVVAHVDGTYRTVPRAGSRAITGHSMGGFGAIRLAMLHPDVFGVAWGMNPCCLCCLARDLPTDLELWRRMGTYGSAAEMWETLREEGDIWPLILAGFGTLLSPDVDEPPLYFEPPYRVEEGRLVGTGALEGWAEKLPLARAAEHVDALHALRGLAFDTAYGDEFAHIPVGTRAFSDTLEALGVAHVYEMYEGDHRNRMSERLPGRVLPWIDARLVHGTSFGPTGAPREPRRERGARLPFLIEPSPPDSVRGSNRPGGTIAGETSRLEREGMEG